MKKIIYICGILFLSIITILNYIYTANLDNFEHIELKVNSLVYIIALIVVEVLIIFVTRKLDNHLNKQDNKKRKYLFFGSLFLYILFTIIWVILVNPNIIGDQVHVCNLAQTFYRGNMEEFLPNMTYAGITLKEYMQAYPQQITLAFVYSIFFRIIHFDVIELLRIINIISNIFIVLATYKINSQLSKQYKTNNILLFVLILTFVSIPMLTTFIYGDMPSLALCLFSIYFMMKYIETKQIKYPLIASILTSIAYLMRMNSLIFIIATVIYLLLNLVQEFKKDNLKSNIFKALIIIAFIVIAIIPSSLIENYYFNKYNLDKDKKYPTISYLLMAMEESNRANGWYNEEIRRKSFKRYREYK